MRRRDALKFGLAAGAVTLATPRRMMQADAAREDPGATVERLTLASIDLELAQGVSVRTLAFNGAVPGPQLRQGLTTLELRNETRSDTVVHSPAFAESLISIPAYACVRARLRTPGRAIEATGAKPYSAYCAVDAGIAAGVMGDTDAYAVDQSQVLSIHRWAPRSIARAAPFRGAAISYDYASFNDKLMRASEPIRVRRGDRLHIHFSNAGSAQSVTLALPRHRFLVVALDGHRVPRPRCVERLFMGPGESIDALVSMDCPGRWILGTTHRHDRTAGLGRLVEYAGARGAPEASDYGVANWNYGWFGAAVKPMPATHRPPAAHALSLRPIQSLGMPFPQLADPTPQTTALTLRVQAGRRYQIAASNVTRDPQSLRLLGHDMELVRIGGQRTLGVRKDVLTVPSFTRIEFEFVARTSALFLAHSRQVILEQAAV